MASTYSANLGIELPATGDQAGTWGTTTNSNLGTLIEQAISGYVTQAITDGADTVITIPNGATGVARNMFIECTGALTADRNLVVPANKKLYFIYNHTTGAHNVTVKVSGQTGVVVPNGMKTVLVCNGTDVVDAANYLSSLTGNAPLTVNRGSDGTLLTLSRTGGSNNPSLGISLNDSTDTVTLALSSGLSSSTAFNFTVNGHTSYNTDSNGRMAIGDPTHAQAASFTNSSAGTAFTASDGTVTSSWRFPDSSLWIGNASSHPVTLMVGNTAVLTVNSNLDTLARGIPICRFKSAATNRATQTVKTNDPDLTYAIPATGTYEIELMIMTNNTGAGGIRLCVNYSGTRTSGASNQGGFASYAGANSVLTAVSMPTVVDGVEVFTNAAGSGVNDYVFIKATLVATSTGTVALSWAQNTSNAANSIVFTGSYMKVTQLS